LAHRQQAFDLGCPARLMVEQLLRRVDLTTLLGLSDRRQTCNAGRQQHTSCKIAQQPPAYQP
jgi:hypothetical protein